MRAQELKISSLYFGWSKFQIQDESPITIQLDKDLSSAQKCRSKRNFLHDKV